MHDIFSPEPDPLDALLSPPAPPDAEALRQRVYAQTIRVLCRRRRLRRAALGIALATSFAAGLLVMYLTVPRPAPELQAPSASEGIAQQPQPVPAVEEPALAREWRAFDSENQRSELYRQAGDSYMTEENDPESALRCYANALDHGTEQDRAISTDDNWLLMAIKGARQKEKGHAKNGG